MAASFGLSELVRKLDADLHRVMHRLNGACEHINSGEYNKAIEYLGETRDKHLLDVGLHVDDIEARAKLLEELLKVRRDLFERARELAEMKMDAAMKMLQQIDFKLLEALGTEEARDLAPAVRRMFVEVGREIGRLHGRYARVPRRDEVATIPVGNDSEDLATTEEDDPPCADPPRADPPKRDKKRKRVTWNDQAGENQDGAGASAKQRTC